MKKTLLICIGVLLITTPLLAQSGTDIQQATIRWNIHELYDSASNSRKAFTCEFVSYGHDKIEWIQSNGARKDVIQITGVTGEWNNVNVPGTIRYRGTLNDQLGSVTIDRNGDLVTIRLQFRRDDKEDMIYEFSVSSFEVL